MLSKILATAAGTALLVGVSLLNPAQEAYDVVNDALPSSPAVQYADCPFGYTELPTPTGSAAITQAADGKEVEIVRLCSDGLQLRRDALDEKLVWIESRDGNVVTRNDLPTVR